jgi:hypothetical protein
MYVKKEIYGIKDVGGMLIMGGNVLNEKKKKMMGKEDDLV